MAQIIQGQNLGGKLGTTLGDTLSYLAQNRLSKLQQQEQKEQQAKGLQSFIQGLTPESALNLINSPDAFQKEYFKQELGRPGNEATQKVLQRLLSDGQDNESNNNGQSVENEQLPKANSQSSREPSLDLSGINPKDSKSLINLALKKREIKAKEKANTLKETQNAFKETKALRQSAYTQGRTAKRSLDDLQRVEELEKEGKLDTPGYVEFLKRSGLDIPALMNPGSEEFNKIIGNFQRGAKEIYGSRITNFELENFLKILPSLSQSPEGRKRVIANLKRLYKGDVLFKDITKKIIRENKNIPPLDILEQIDDRLDEQLDKLADEFKADLSKEVPKGQNKFITALQAGTGSLIGLPGTIAGGIGKLLSQAI